MKTMHTDELSEILRMKYSDPTQVLTPKGADDSLLEALGQAMENKPTIIGPAGPTCSSSVIGLESGAELWLSIFGSLATIIGESNVAESTLIQIESTLAQMQWKYVPENLVTSQISEDYDYSWFDELFGYY